MHAPAGSRAAAAGPRRECVRTGSLLFLPGHARCATAGTSACARSAVGMQQLHYGMAVEVEAVIEIEG
jgi:enamine deaminase RidA (YjgF/YER057c/UK114 family)